MAQRKPQHCELQPRRRRTHHKSRHGCSECKARHIKCDENRPQCTNCLMSERQCAFPEPRHSYSASGAAAVSVKSGNVASLVPDGTVHFTVVHMACLHHAEAHMEEYMALNGSAKPFIDIAIDNIAVTPFLLDQVLALSALHLSTKDVSKRSLYHRQATELQTRALELFNQTRDELCSTKCTPIFLFASLLGIHTLWETLMGHHDNLSTFVEAFIRYLHLHRGVRAFLNNESWTQILESDLKPLLFLSDVSKSIDKQTRGTETFKLKEFLESYEPGSQSVGACQSALEWIQWMLDLCKQDPSKEYLQIHATLAWPLVIPDRYIEALQQRRPEAFAVLAFYAAALHRNRQYWVFGKSGSSLLGLISTTIGSYWLDHLDLPTDECLEL